MRFLIDQNRSPRLAALLRDHGHDAAHTIELGLERAQDIDLLLLAEREDRIIVSADTDFGTLLALSGDTRPSIILFRSRSALTADQHAELILDNLDDIAPDLVEGACRHQRRPHPDSPSTVLARHLSPIGDPEYTPRRCSQGCSQMGPLRCQEGPELVISDE